MSVPCCPHPVERHAYNGCANCGCSVTWTEHPDRAKDTSIEGLMALGVNPKGPRIRLLVLAKTLERLLPCVPVTSVESTVDGPTTVHHEVAKVIDGMREIAGALDRPDTECPICEVGQPMPLEQRNGKTVARWTCGHWLNYTHTDVVRR